MVLRKEPIGGTVNPIKRSQEDTVTDEEKCVQHNTPQTFLNKEDYEGDTDENNSFTYDLWTGNDDFVRNFYKEQEN